MREYSELLKNLSKEKPELILGLDYNLDLLKITQHKPTEEFLECNIESGMIPQITKPTCITQTSATLIDNVIVSKKLSTHIESRILIENISNHLPSLVSLGNYHHSQNKGVKIYSRDTHKKSLEKLREALENINWDSQLKPYRKNIDVMTDRFQRLLGENVDHFTPYRERTINHKKLRKEKWVTGALLISIQKGKRLYKKSISNQATDADRKRYYDYMLVLRKVKRFAKKSYYLNMCVDFRANTRELWKTINQVIGRTSDKSTCIQELKANNLMLSRKKDIVNELGKFFSTVGEKFAKRTQRPMKELNNYLSLILRNKNSIFLMAMSTSEIVRMINKLPNKKSSGYDKVDNILLKYIRNAVAAPLSMIFNESLSQGIFPTCMKLAEVVPLYKGKDRNEKSNYRPISLLLTISKILEKIMYKRVYKFLNNTNQFYYSQFGFRTGHLCNQVICELVGEIVKNTEKNWTTVCVFLDLLKAFDTLEHSTVIQKLECYGIRGNALDWFRSYLDNRSIRVKLDQVRSNEFPIHYGAPQGSCLGPPIFLIFCNNLNIHLENMQCIQFADDTTLYLGHPNPDILIK